MRLLCGIALDDDEHNSVRWDASTCITVLSAPMTLCDGESSALTMTMARNLWFDGLNWPAPAAAITGAPTAALPKRSR
jgi:hypothetical protein